MKTAVVVAIIIITVLLVSIVEYIFTYAPKSTPVSNPTPTPSPTKVPEATVTAKIIMTAKDGILLVNGTVTNNSPNSAYNVGLHVIAPANPALYPFEETQDVTVPVASGTYEVGATYALSTLSSYQIVPINITIVATNSFQQLILGDATVKVIWSNMR